MLAVLIALLAAALTFWLLTAIGMPVLLAAVAAIIILLALFSPTGRGYFRRF